MVILRGANGVFSTGADMQNSYSWYGADGEKRRPSQRRRLGVDRESFGFYHDYLTFPKVTIAQVETYALGGAFELALMSDIAVVGRDARLGMPGARLLGPALGNLHLFFYRLGPVLSRRLLLTGDTVVAGELEHLGIFTDVCEPDAVANAAEGWAQKVARMPADGLAIAKTSFSLIEQTTAYAGRRRRAIWSTRSRPTSGSRTTSSTSSRPGRRSAPAKPSRQRDAHFDTDEPS